MGFFNINKIELELKLLLNFVLCPKTFNLLDIELAPLPSMYKLKISLTIFASSLFITKTLFLPI